MPIYSASTTGATDFDGLTAATGLFDAAVSTGSPSIQVRINSISFKAGSAITDWTLALVDPSDSVSTELLTDTTTDLVVGGPGGFMLLPTNSDGAPWNVTLVTTGLDAGGTLKIDYDFAESEG
jgi:hypothetical protein